MPNVHELIRDHVTLSIRCLDRLYLHAYMPKLQTSGGLCYFLRDHLGHPIPSPALFAPMLERFVGAIKTYATTQTVPLISFERGQRKDDVVADYRARRPLSDGVVVIGVAQEKMRAFKAHKRFGPQGGVTFDFSRQSVAVNHYYFYVQDPDWGPAFLNFGTYVPYPIKLCLNAHEWVKQQLRRADVAFDSLDNGFLACADPTRLQAICERLGPADVQAFFDRWTARLPPPLTALDRAAGYTHRLALQQVEVSLTQVFARPVQGRHFFEAVIRENLDLGRPDRVGLLFPHRITRRTPPPTWGYRTRVITDGVEPSLHIEYKSSHVKQYFKEQRALRTETTINNPNDFHVAKAVPNLAHLRDLGDQVNRKLLEVERVSHQCVLTQDALDFKPGRPSNPAALLLAALKMRDLEPRLSEALPWVAWRYPDLDWEWLIREAKLHDLQNRLGFVVALARQVVERKGQAATAEALAAAEQRLERSRLVREDTFCRESMTQAERRWLRNRRSVHAQHWNLLTGLVPEHLSYFA